MPYTIDRLADQPVIIVTISDPYDQTADTGPAVKQFDAFVQQMPGHIYRLIDISHWSMSFQDVVEVLARDSREGAKTSLNARMTTIIVGTSEMAKFSANATGQRQYGYAKQAVIFGSMEEALAHVQSELDKETN